MATYKKMGIVEYEQKGEDRASYGTNLLTDITIKLKNKKIKGLSKRNLHYCCQFYRSYPGISALLTDRLLSKEIVQTVSAQFGKATNEKEEKGVSPSELITQLSFSHIIELVNLDSSLHRAFYELQAIKGKWSVRELKRQKESLLYERTGISINKEELLQDVNNKSNTITPLEIMRDPPIGIVLCTDKKSATVKYATGSIDNQLFVSSYLLQLPTIDEIKKFIEQDNRYLGGT